MKFIAKAALVLLFAVVVVAVDGSVGNNKATAHDGHDHSVAQSQPQQTNTQSAADVTYSYATQPGDTYSYMARKAVQTYGKKANIQLTLAQILYAETSLTQAAGSPQLGTSQKVEIKESIIKQWVEKAKLLTADQQAAWNYYVQFVDFNTDHVGTA